MTNEEYTDFLTKAPADHFSTAFKYFLINNNKVRFINQDWLAINNTKYWTEENDWITAFYIGERQDDFDFFIMNIPNLARNVIMSDREILVKHPSKRTVKLFHLHLIKKN